MTRSAPLCLPSAMSSTNEDERTVGRDNVVTVERVPLQLAKQPCRRTCAELRVLVRRHLSAPACLARHRSASVAESVGLCACAFLLLSEEHTVGATCPINLRLRALGISHLRHM